MSGNASSPVLQAQPEPEYPVLSPEQRARMKRALWGDESDNYHGPAVAGSAEVSRLRDALAEAHQENEILREELAQARTALQIVWQE